MGAPAKLEGPMKNNATSFQLTASFGDGTPRRTKTGGQTRACEVALPNVEGPIYLNKGMAPVPLVCDTDITTSTKTTTTTTAALYRSAENSSLGQNLWVANYHREHKFQRCM